MSLVKFCRILDQSRNLLFPNTNRELSEEEIKKTIPFTTFHSAPGPWDLQTLSPPLPGSVGDSLSLRQFSMIKGQELMNTGSQVPSSEGTVVRGFGPLLRCAWCPLGPVAHRLDGVLLHWLFLLPCLRTLSPCLRLCFWGTSLLIIRCTHSIPWREWSRLQIYVSSVNSLGAPLLKEVLGDYQPAVVFPSRPSGYLTH